MKKILFLLLIVLFLIPVISAKENGVADQDLDIVSGGAQGGGSCGTNCHQTTPAGEVATFTITPCCTFFTSQNNINITVTTSGISQADNILGVALYNNDSLPQNIEDDGWNITADPNGNAGAFNYNMKTGLATLNQTFSWNVTAPANTGTYYMIGHARHGGASFYNVTTPPITLTVISQPATVTDTPAVSLIGFWQVYFVLGVFSFLLFIVGYTTETELNGIYYLLSAAAFSALMFLSSAVGKVRGDQLTTSSYVSLMVLFGGLVILSVLLFVSFVFEKVEEEIPL